MANTLTVIQDVIHYYAQLPAVEITAVAASLAYPILAARGNIYCWLAAFISTVLYTIIFYDVYLWMDSALQIYYLAMAIYGWWCWRKKPTTTTSAMNDITNIEIMNKPTLVYQQLSLKKHLSAIVSLLLLSLTIGWFMANYTPADFPYLDSFTSIFAVYATYLTTQKVVENWLYFMVINSISIYLYIEKALHATTGLFIAYVILSIYGYMQWRKLYLQQSLQQKLQQNLQQNSQQTTLIE